MQKSGGSIPSMRAAVAIIATLLTLTGTARPAPTSAPARSPNADYLALFGDEERRVAATPSTKDDAKFAVELVDKARNLSDEPQLVQLMYEKAYEFGSKDPDGYAAAVEAAKRLMAKAGTKSDWRAKLGNLYRLQVRTEVGPQRSAAGDALIDLLMEDAQELSTARKFADAVKQYRDASVIASTVRSMRSDEISEALKDAQARQLIADRIGKLDLQLAANPADDAVRHQIVLQYLGSLDDPADAVRYATGDKDPLTREAVQMAAKPTTELSEGQCLKVGGWYRHLADDNGISSAAKWTFLDRAEGYFQRFIAVHDAKDAQRLQVTQELEDVTRRIKALPPNGGSLLDRIVIWNQHNSTSNDCGTDALNVSLQLNGQEVWRRDAVAVAWAPSTDRATTVVVPKVKFDVIRVEISAIHGRCGGLAEIQLFRNGINVAKGCPVTVSASYNDFLSGKNLTDGIVSSAEVNKGYWCLPPGATGWAQVQLGLK